MASERGNRVFRRFCFVMAAIATLVLVNVQATAAQRLRGKLLDSQSNAPVDAGFLTLLTSDSLLISTSVTDEEGNWSLEVPEPGVYFVQARRLGYVPWVAGPVTLQPDDDLNSVFHLQRLAVMLAPIEVSALQTRRALELNGFYERQRSDFGHFMSPDEIERRQATTLTDLMLSLPGVNFVTMSTGSVGARYVTLRGGSLSRNGVCRPRVFVDGLMYARGDARAKRTEDAVDTEQLLEDRLFELDQGLSLDDIGHPSSIAAIEIYRSAAQVPVQFGGTSIETQCGVIVVWTRTGRMRMN